MGYLQLSVCCWNSLMPFNELEEKLQWYVKWNILSLLAQKLGHGYRCIQVIVFWGMTLCSDVVGYQVLSQIVAGFTVWSLRFSLKAVHVESLVKKTVLEQVFLWLLWFSPVSNHSTNAPYTSIFILIFRAWKFVLFEVPVARNSFSLHLYHQIMQNLHTVMWIYFIQL
jgi:hypothetical protein